MPYLWFNDSIRMDEGIIQIALWIGGIFLMIISGLLAWIGVMQRETKRIIYLKNDEQDKRLDKHDEKFDKVHEEIKDLAISIAESVKRRK